MADNTRYEYFRVVSPRLGTPVSKIAAWVEIVTWEEKGLLSFFILHSCPQKKGLWYAEAVPAFQHACGCLIQMCTNSSSHMVLKKGTANCRGMPVGLNAKAGAKTLVLMSRLLKVSLFHEASGF